jgi:DNA-binding CsgD family transcriptional regulator
MALDAASTLVRLGRLDEAAVAIERASIDLREGGPRLRAGVNVPVIALEIRRGRLNKAKQALDLIEGILDPGDVTYYALVQSLRAEYALASREWATALAVADAGLSTPGIDRAEHYGNALCAHAVRAITETIEDDRRHARRTPRHDADRFVALAESFLAKIRARGGQPSPDQIGYTLLARAERTRHLPTPDPALWSAMTDHWEQLGDPYLTAYARWRNAEALLRGRAPRHTAAPLLYEAHHAAAGIGAALLAAQIAEFARWAGIDLAAPPTATVPNASPPENAYGLTRREKEVLALLARGLSNGEIARELFISPKTASVHVSAILRKLGVTSRIHAAAIAHRTAPTASDTENAN